MLAAVLHGQEDLRLDILRDRSCGKRLSRPSTKDYGWKATDVSIEATGSPSDVKQSVRTVRKGEGGIVTLFGAAPAESRTDFNSFYMYSREIRKNGSFSLTADTSRRSLSLLGAKRVDIKPIVTARIPLTEVKTGLRMLEKNVGPKK